MKTYTFLVPLVRDDSKLPHGGLVWRRLESKLTELAGGFSRGGVVRGAWKDELGAVVRDSSIPYTVAIEGGADGAGGSCENPALVRIVSEFIKLEFCQRCVFYTVGEGYIV